MDKLENSVENFFQFWGGQLKLEKRRKITKPTSYEVVAWNAQAAIKRWNAEQILANFFPDIAAQRTLNEASFLTYENKVKYIKSEMKRLSEYNLPVPNNL